MPTYAPTLVPTPQPVPAPSANYTSPEGDSPCDAKFENAPWDGEEWDCDDGVANSWTCGQLTAAGYDCAGCTC
jgi:hypothetical protein